MALIDADVLCYIVGSLVSSGDEAFTVLRHRIRLLCDLTNHRSHLLFVSCKTKDGFRKNKVANYYKSNRKGAVRPVFYEECREILLKELGAIMLPELEADDAISIYASFPAHHNATVVSADKDFYSTPCNFLHVNFKRREHKYTIVDEETAFYNHMLQTLIGDSADGYKGCPGIGEKRSLDIISKSDTMSSMWEKVVNTYKKKGLGENEAVENARLAYLLRSEDYDIDTGKIELWTPERKIK